MLGHNHFLHPLYFISWSLLQLSLFLSARLHWFFFLCRKSLPIYNFKKYECRSLYFFSLYIVTLPPKHKYLFWKKIFFNISTHLLLEFLLFVCYISLICSLSLIFSLIILLLFLNIARILKLMFYIANLIFFIVHFTYCTFFNHAFILLKSAFRPFRF